MLSGTKADIIIYRLESAENAIKNEKPIAVFDQLY